MLILHSGSYDVEPKLQGHDPVSTMQKMSGPNFPLSWSGQAWERVSPMDVVTWRQSATIFLCIRPFSTSRRTNTQTTKQLGDPRVNLLLASEKAVCCNNV